MKDVKCVNSPLRQQSIITQPESVAQSDAVDEYTPFEDCFAEISKINEGVTQGRMLRSIRHSRKEYYPY